MKRINMTKYGFVRWPEQDFSDDGNRFTCYKVGNRVCVSKCTHSGDVWIDGSIYGTKLPCEVYSKLPHYKAIGELNGVSTASLTDQDLIDLYNACLAYEQEYTAAENAFELPTKDEIAEQCRKVQAKRKQELDHIGKLLSEKAVVLALRLGEYRWKTVQDYLKSIANKYASYAPEVYVPQALNTEWSFRFCKPDCSELMDCWYYTELVNIMNSVEA